MSNGGHLVHTSPPSQDRRAPEGGQDRRPYYHATGMHNMWTNCFYQGKQPASRTKKKLTRSNELHLQSLRSSFALSTVCSLETAAQT